MQMSEDWILIHDDWEDGSLERRGKPALHHLVSSEIAINAGDTLHECMHRVLCENFRLLDVDLARKVQHEFFLMLGRTTFGQYAEIKWTQDNKDDMTEEDVLFTVSGKTVYYTIAGPLRLGALLAGATDEQLQRIYKFSYPLGLCFQIRDDVLDLTGDFEGQKKQKLNDIFEGKRTLILLHLLSHCSPE
jgi:geranylgeranyl diphosphate synthase type II